MNRLSYCAALLALAASVAPPSSNAQQTEVPAKTYHSTDSGWLEREVYRSPADGRIAVEFVDVLVGAGRTALVKEMPAGALLDVKAGAAIVTVDKKHVPSAAGSVIRIDQGQMLSIDNRKSERAFVARLIRIGVSR